MSDVDILRKQVKKMVEEASGKELEIVYRVFEATNSNDWWNEISDEQKAAIDKGIAQLDNNEGLRHTEVMKKYGKWFRK
jgi:hypothetical protein